MNERETPAAWPTRDQPTGDPLVDDALGALETLPTAPVSGHSAVYDAVHDALRAALEEHDGEEP